MAASKNPITKLRKDIDSLRRTYTGAFASANKAVYEGIEQLAEHELAAIRTHYEEALTSLRELKRGGAPKELAMAQLQLLQDTVDRILGNARESLAILDSTRREISSQIRRHLEESEQTLTDAGTQVRSAARQGTRRTLSTAKRKTAQAESTAGNVATRARSTTADAGLLSAEPSSSTKPTAKKRSSATTARKRSTAKRRTAAPKTGKTRTSAGSTSASSAKKKTTTSAARKKTPAKAKGGASTKTSAASSRASQPKKATRARKSAPTPSSTDSDSPGSGS